MTEMNLKLYILKRDDARDYTLRTYIRFAVIDLDRSKKYPENFVCVLPQQLSSIVGQSSVFANLFGGKSLELAKKLLSDALKTEDDTEIKAEIEKRLKTFQPKPTASGKCVVCGNAFQLRRTGRYKQKICPECRRKQYSSQE
jgi:hypothetical protein